MRQAVLLAAATAVATVAAQNFTINPSEVDKGTRIGWCNAQYNTCSTLCANNPTADSCDPDTLQYVCTCSNGSSPGLIYYTQTLPTFICQQAFSDCIATNTGSSQAQDQCKKNILAKCGTLDPTKAQVGGGSSGTTSGAASPTSSTAGTQSSAAAASSSTHRAAAPTNAAYVGNGVAVVAAAGVLAALL